DRGPDQLMLDPSSGVLAVGMDVRLFARSPGQERDLVDRCVEANAVAVIGDEPGRGTAVSRKPVNETVAENIQIVGPTVVAERPDDLDAVAAGRLQRGLQGGEVIASAGFDQMPAGAFP